MNNAQKDSKSLANDTLRLRRLEAKYNRLRLAAKAVGQRNGSCWLYLALYGAERGG